MVEVKIKGQKYKNPVIGSTEQVANHVKINGEKFYYNVVYDVSEAFYNKHKSIFTKLN